MAEQKKRGFHALEQRIHELEAEDAKSERGAPGAASGERRAEEARREQPAERKGEPRSK